MNIQTSDITFIILVLIPVGLFLNGFMLIVLYRFFEASK